MSREELPADEDFLSRWSRRKQEAKSEGEQNPESSLQALQEVDENENEELPPLTDEDMPPVESLTEDSDYSGFMSPGVSEELRQIALRKLFRSAAFNVCDGLDDYDEDFTSFAKLGDIVTADMRFQMEQQARRKMEELVADEDPAELPEQQVEDDDAQVELAAEPGDEAVPEGSAISEQTGAEQTGTPDDRETT